MLGRSTSSSVMPAGIGRGRGGCRPAAGRCYRVVLDSTDWVTGDDFMTNMSAALVQCKTTAALWSGAYFTEGSFSLRELVAADLAKICEPRSTESPRLAA